ncbi:hypothetical protein N657DRAFT_642173 [Parathielavia appendiculata]|uniref:Uncharacterized protein n=1 Tax=Parathielavia appendiculata TaxID=2587402 RepID=A0AAN6Z4L9_9PEZI|nr:hypothetical protein N657DRAFT_642173 [Parathielavia appendiculata]
MSAPQPPPNRWQTCITHGHAGSVNPSAAIDVHVSSSGIHIRPFPATPPTSASRCIMRYQQSSLCTMTTASPKLSAPSRSALRRGGSRK